MPDIHSRPLRYAVVGILIGSAVAIDCNGQTTDNRRVSLREQLVFGLQVRRPVEFAFIDAVTDTVDRGELPQSLVIRVFAYARARRQRDSRLRRPIIFFQPAMQQVAGKLKIKIEPDPAP